VAVGINVVAAEDGVAGARGDDVVGAVAAPLRGGVVAAPLVDEAVGVAGVDVSGSGEETGAAGDGFGVFGFGRFGFGVLVCGADAAAGGVGFRGRSGAPPNCARASPAHASTTSQDAPTARADPIAQR
jgi:hypothetical protein